MWRRMCFGAAEGRTFQQRKLHRETRIYAPKEPLSGSSSLGEKTSSKCTEFQQKRPFRQATAVGPFLELCQEFKENRTKVYSNEIRQMAYDRCPFDLSPHPLRIWHKLFVHNHDKFSECLTGNSVVIISSRYNKPMHVIYCILHHILHTIFWFLNKSL